MVSIDFKIRRIGSKYKQAIFDDVINIELKAGPRIHGVVGAKYEVVI